MLYLPLIALALAMAATVQSSPQLSIRSATAVPLIALQRRLAAVNVAKIRPGSQRASSIVCQAVDPLYACQVQRFNSVARRDSDLSLPELLIEVQMFANECQKMQIAVDAKVADRFKIAVPQLQIIIREAAQNLALTNPNEHIIENANALATSLMTVASLFSFLSRTEMMLCQKTAEIMTVALYLPALERALYQAIGRLDENASLENDKLTLERQRHSPMLYALQLSLDTLYYYMLCEKQWKISDWGIAAESDASRAQPASMQKTC